MDAVFCTNSICSPSRASILTGTYSHVNGVSSIWTEMDYRVPTFAEVLQGSGYRTAMFGKWHLGEHGQALPRGFDTWKIFPGQGDYVDPAMIDESGTRIVPGYATDIVTDLSLEWLDGLGEDEPFCMLVHHKAPHRPWIPDEKHRHLYADGTIPEPETFFDDNQTRSRAVRAVHMTIADDMGADDLKQDIPDHLRGQKGLAENTLVVYTSDQGFFLGDHGWFDKRLMFDQSLQMPMLIQWPAAVEAGSRCEAIITNVDFAATFLDACGIDAAAELPTSQGRSFLPLLRGEQVEDWPDAAYYRYWEHDDPIHAAPAHYGIRTADHKLIHYYGAGLGVPGASDRVFESEWELYDLRADPSELRNVADDPAYAAVRAGLEVKLAEYQFRYRDEPYRGPDTPRPVWGPYDEETLERVKRVFAR
jgi:arylsulfatase A-like enzyme